MVTVTPVRWRVVRGSPTQLWLSSAARVVLAGVLLVAGGLKITSPQQATRAVQAYEILPSGIDQFIGYGLPVLEVILGLLLLLGLFIRLSAAVTGVLMVLFIAGVASAWVRGLSIDCGCFGGGGNVAPDQTRYLQEILRDLLFLGLACWLVAYPASKFALDRAVWDDEGATERVDFIDDEETRNVTETEK